MNQVKALSLSLSFSVPYVGLILETNLDQLERNNEESLCIKGVIRVGEKVSVGIRVKNPKPNLTQEAPGISAAFLFFSCRLYLGNTSTDTSQDGETLPVDILAEDALVEDGVLLVGSKLSGTLGSLDHDGRDDSTVKCTESTRKRNKI